jgi:hypothetical protein
MYSMDADHQTWHLGRLYSNRSLFNSMTDLSPTARKVLDAFLGDAEDTGLQMDDMRENVAAALRAAVDLVVPAGGSRKNNDIRAELLVIADELEGL